MGGIGFEKIAKILLIAIIASMILTFAFDYITILAYREEVRVQTYIGGFYVAGMAANPTELAKGETEHSKLYTEEAIKEEFINFTQASFGGMRGGGKGGPDGRIDSGGTIHVQYKIDNIMIRDVIASCEILPGGVVITTEYRVDPRINMLFGGTIMPDFPLYRIRTTRNFRILGQ